MARLGHARATAWPALALALTLVVLTGCVGDGGGFVGLPGSEDDTPSPADDGADDNDPYDVGPVASPTTAERYAEVRCQALAACECTYEPYATPFDCERITAAHFRKLQLEATGASIDLACLDTVLAALATEPCDLGADLVATAQLPTCFVYRGEATAGQPCSAANAGWTRTDTCAPELACTLALDGWRCRVPNIPTPEPSEGAVCGDGPDATADCGATLYCHPQTSRCTARPGLGQLCPAQSACAGGHWCSGNIPDGTASCQAQVAVGEACGTSRSCAAVCPTDGTACTAGLCAAGECVEPQPLACLPTVL